MNWDAAGDDWQQVLVLQNTSAAALKRDNFDPVWGPRGDGEIIQGDQDPANLDDVLSGTRDDDILSGLQGNDVLYGGAGYDTLDGGEGEDTFDDTQDANVFIGGAGNDHFNSVSGSWSTDTFSGGDGSDTYHLASYIWNGYPADVVTDFQAGAGGDVLDISSLQSQFNWYYGYSYENSPFQGFLRLQQEGTDTSLQVNWDAAGDDWQTVLVLQHTDAAAVTRDNIAPEWGPWRDGETIRGDQDPANPDDVLNGTRDNDLLLGLQGNDTLYGGSGSDTLEGGEGDDSFDDTQEANLFVGGAGSDHFYNVSGSWATDSFSGGAGSDTYHLAMYWWSSYVADLVVDFEAGAGGDVLDISYLQQQFGWWGGYSPASNPFTSGYLRLEQTAADTSLMLNWDGSSEDWQLVLVLQNTNAADFTTANFNPGWSPAGTGQVITGDQDPANPNDWLGGTVDDDTMLGLEGQDSLHAYDGDDVLEGGNDNDVLYGYGGSDMLSGGAGNDYLAGNTGDDVLDAGEGDDYFDDSEGANVFSGGVGNDFFQNVAYGFGADTFSGGEGRDTYNLTSYWYYLYYYGLTADRITDFQTGAGGDLLDIDELVGQFSGYSGELNPFTSGWMRLAQDGTDTLLQVNLDASGDDWMTALVLQNTDVANFSVDNFAPAWSLTGVGQLITGDQDPQNLSDSLGGTRDADTIRGLEGNDTLYGGDGSDTLEGGNADDVLYGQAGSDALEGGEGNDALYGEGGQDTLSGGAGNDYLAGQSGDDVLEGGDGDDYFDDTEGANVFRGGAGNDYFQNVAYALSADTFSGGEGRDTYNLTSNWYYLYYYGLVADQITDFQVGAGGDLLDIDELANHFNGYSWELNPFTHGWLRLQQDGTSTLLQVNFDASGDDWQTALVLQDTNAAGFTAENFAPVWNPAGIGQLITGDQDPENLNDSLGGTRDADTLVGLEGNDTLYGGDAGDTLEGGNADDVLYGQSGSDLLQGGAGNDSLYGNSWDDVLEGGEGDDHFDDTEGGNVFSGGAGNDFFQNVAYGSGSDTFSGGDGRDTYNLTADWWYLTYYGLTGDRITDFQTGAGGDLLDIDELVGQFSGYNWELNPFQYGWMRLEAAGADTLLQVNLDASGDDWMTALVVQNTDAANFTADNFAPAWNPTREGQLITGDQNPENLNDSLAGTRDADTIRGLEGNDTLYGGDAGDTLEGGNADDVLYGQSGSDLLQGGAGNDSLYGNSWDDVLEGGEGDDHFDDTEGGNVFSGGAGNDFFQNVAYGSGSDTFNGGDGRDTYNLTADWWYLTYYGVTADRITDFQTGAGGDLLDIDELVGQFSGYSWDLNPFTSGWLRLAQDGTDTLLQVNLDASGDDWMTALVLQNTNVANFTVDNFAPAWNFNGVGQLITGDQDPQNLNDSLGGTRDADTIRGLEANDTLYGGDGSDTLEGGNADDVLYGQAGSDALEGGEGNDALYGEGGQDTLSGGAGNDYLAGHSGDDVLDGGEGDDSFDDTEGANVFSGGVGNDFFQNVAYGFGADTFSGGEGRDTYNLTAYWWYLTNYGLTADRLTDFQTGAGGDLLDIDEFVSQFSGYSLDLNPFTSGWMRLAQDGTDTLLQVNLDASGDDWMTALVLQNTNVANFTVDNFAPAWNFNGVGQLITGDQDPQNLNDSLGGTRDADTIRGLEANDTLYGGDGSDTLEGGSGDDMLYGQSGSDLLQGGPGNDYLEGNSWDDVLVGGDGDDRIIDTEGVNLIQGDAGNDTLHGAGTVEGGAGNDSLTGSDSPDTLDGGADHDTISAGWGADAVTGGTGNDFIHLGHGDDTVDAGDGSDTINGAEGDDLVRGGAGLDVYVANGNAADFSLVAGPGGAWVLTDLRTGADGADTLDGMELVSFWDDESALVTMPGISWEDMLGVDNQVPNEASTQGEPSEAQLHGDDTLHGNSGFDVLGGSYGSDSILGGVGNDVLSGDSGRDTLAGEEGDDTLYGGAGQDLLLGGDDADQLFGGLAADSLLGGAGNDYLHDSQGDNLLQGGDGDDRLGNYWWDRSTGTLEGGSGMDTIYGSGLLLGGADGDYLEGTGTLQGGTGADYVVVMQGAGYGESGNDTMSAGGWGGPKLLDGGTGNDLVTGWWGDETLVGGDGADTLDGAYEQDSLLGGIGADFLTGGEGHDTLDGGDDYDVANYGSARGHYSIVSDGEGGTLVLANRGSDGDDLVRHVETLRFTDIDFEPALGAVGRIATGTDLADTLTGGQYDDSLAGGAGDDVLGRADAAGDGNDRLDGGAGDDSATGGGGNDVLWGGEGNDTLDGGDGEDRLEGGDGNDSVLGGAGNDTLVSGAGADTLDGGDGDDHVVDTENGNLLLGGFGNDYLWGQGTVQGGAGNDTIDYRSSGLLEGGDGDDFVAGNGTLRGGAGADIITVYGGVGQGEDGNDTISAAWDWTWDLLDGGSGADSLTGYGGNDTLLAGANDDTLSGGRDDDTLYGGSGYDKALYSGAKGDYWVVDNGDGSYTVTDLRGAWADGTDRVYGVELLVFTDDEQALITTNTGVEYVGTDFDDILIGDSGNDTITGFAGNDRLGGDDANDTILGGDGNDVISGDSGDDTLRGGEGIDTIDGGSGADSVFGDGGADILEGGQGSDTIDGGDGDDRINDTSSGENVIAGGLGNDTITANGTVSGGDGGDWIYGSGQLAGGEDDDTLFGSGTLDGDAGADTLYVDHASLGRGGDGNDVLQGWTPYWYYDGSQALEGGAGDDALYGRYSSDTLRGDAGADTLVGGAQGDAIDGGADLDVVIFGDRREHYSVVQDGVGGYLVVDNRGEYRGDIHDEGTDSVTGVETAAFSNLEMPLSAANTGTIQTGTGLGDSLGGSAFDDSLAGGEGDDTLFGDTGHDRIDGDLGADSIDAGDGNDVVFAGNGADTVEGGSGEDRVHGGADADSISGGADSDTLAGDAGADTLLGDDGADQIFGGDGDDSIVAGEGDDYVGDHSGNNQVTGGGGNDYLSASGTVTGGLGNDYLYGSGQLAGDEGDDTVQGSGTLSGGVGNDNLYGWDGAVLLGEADNDYLSGDWGRQTLVGGDGQDTLDGGWGDDSLSGGSSSDTLYGGEGNDSLDGGTGTDFIAGGGGNDTIDGGGAGAGGPDIVRYFGNRNDFNVVEVGDGTVLVSDLRPGAPEGLDTLTRVRILRFDDADYVAAANPGEHLVGTEGEDTIGEVGQTSAGVTNPDPFGRLHAGSGDDTLEGLAGADSLLGLAGEDVVLGGEGNDIIEGGTESDRLFGEAGADDIRGGDEDDYAEGDTGDDSITGGIGEDLLAGGSFDADGDNGWNDVDVADGGNDTISGGDDNDTLLGGSGNDLLAGDAGHDVIYGHGDADTLLGGSGNDTLDGGAGDDSLDGGDGLNNLSGGAGDDTLAGSGAQDGGAGNDLLVGTGGNDTLKGGTGSDTLVSAGGIDSIDGGEDQGGLDVDVLVVNGLRDHYTVAGTEAGLLVVDNRNGTATLSATNVETLRFNDGDVAAAGGLILTGNDLGNLFVGTDSDDDFLGRDGNDTLTGGGGNDHLEGGAEDDSISGGAGQDGLLGGSGHDTIDGGAGDDVLDGQDGPDQMIGGEGNDTLRAGYGEDTLQGDAGADHLEGANNDDSLLGGDGADTLLGGHGNDTLEGGADADSLTDYEGTNRLDGGLGDDVLAGSGTLLGGEGNDHIAASWRSTADGGAGADTIYAGGDAIVEGGADADLILGSAGNDTLIGGSDAANDTISGDAGADLLQAGGGDDLLSGGSGNDVIDGGEGFDVVQLTGVRAQYTIAHLGDGRYIVRDNRSDNPAVPGPDGEDTISGVERLVFSDTSTFDPTPENTGGWRDGNFEANHIIGDDRDETLRGFGGDDTLEGNGGNDFLDGDKDNDSLVGGAGNDTLDGGDHTDTMIGGTGDDVYRVNSVADVITEAANEGTDTVEVHFDGGENPEVSTYSIEALAHVENLAYEGGVRFHGTGNGLANVLTGGILDDTLLGGAGDDTLDGGAGADAMAGGAGNDTYVVDLTTDAVAELANEGFDTIRTSLQNLSIAELPDVEAIVYTGSLDFTGTGNGGANSIEGGLGNDSLDGGAGDDTLVGAGGDDRLTGGLGADVFTYDASAASGRDTIADAELGDRIALRNLVLTGPVRQGGDPATLAIGQAMVSSDAAGGVTTLQVRTSTGTLTIDLQGSFTAGNLRVGTDGTDSTLTLVPLNTAPSATADAVDATEDTTRTIAATTLLVNDTDADGDPLSITEVGNAVNGAVSLSGGSVVFTPDVNFHGVGSFSYTVSDGKGGTSTATVVVNVAPVNDAPVANADTAAGTEDQALTIAAATLLANDTDVEGDALTVTSVASGMGGTVMLAGDNVVFTPTTNFNGAGSFTYTASDGNGGTSTATVMVNVAPVNDDPATNADTAAGTEDQALTIAAATLLANDTDVDGDMLSVTSVANGIGGTVALSAGSIVFTPNPDFNGPGSFGYTVADGNGGTSTASVTVNVAPVNDAPVANADTVAAAEDQALTLAAATLLANDTDVDGDQLTITGVANGIGGTATLSGGGILFTPDVNFNGAASFSYTASDGNGGTSTASVTVNVAPVNDAPVANADTVAATEDQALTLAAATLLANDTDVDGDTLAITAVASGTGGTVALSGGNVVFTPTADFNGPASFNYTASDGHGGTATASVTVLVAPVNDAPVANGDTAAATEDLALVIASASLLANDTDVDGDTLAVTGVTNGTGGTVALSGGSVTFTPTANFNGTGSFSYTASDGNGGTSTATVTVNVVAVNDAPVASADTVAATEDESLTLTAAALLANDSDVDGDTLSLTGVGNGTGGSVVLSGGDIVFTPDANFHGAGSFSYTVTDGNGLGSAATVTVNVAPVNDIPVAQAGTASTNEGSSVSGQLVATDTDGDTLVYSLVQAPSHGRLTLLGDGSYTYDPDTGYSGPDSFTFQARDGSASSAPAAVAIEVIFVNDPPKAAGSSLAVLEDTPKAGRVTATDPDGDTLTYRVLIAPTHGTLEFGSDGAYTYTPGAQYSGSDSFRFEASDGSLASSADVSIAVSAVKDAPVGQPGTVATTEDLPVSGSVQATDVDSATLTFKLAASTTHGSIEVRTDGTFSYRPDADFNGTDSFTFTASDGELTSDAQTMTIEVAGVPDHHTGGVTISGNAAAGATLEAASTLADVDGMGPLSWQWLADGVAIDGATDSTFTLGQAQVGKSVTVRASYTDAGGTPEAALSAPTGLVSSEPFDLQGMVYHWKNHALLSDVTLQGALASALAASGDLFDLRGAHYDAAEHSVSVQVWTNATTAMETLDFAVRADGGAVSFANALPGNWTVQAQEQGGVGGVRVAAILTDPASSGVMGELQVGTLKVMLAAANNGAGLEFSGIQVGTTAANAFRVDLGGDLTGTDGKFLFEQVPSGSLALSAARGLGDVAGAVTSADALAALRIAVGINPNPDPDGPTGARTPLKLSPYQVIAADATQDGKVTSADALAILRMAVRSPLAPEQKWMFAREDLDLWNEVANTSGLTRTAAGWNATLDQQLLQDTTMNLVAVLRGDVNGSWSAGAGASVVDNAHFQALSTQTGVPLDVWGI